jgi:hypothetical protein
MEVEKMTKHSSPRLLLYIPSATPSPFSQADGIHSMAGLLARESTIPCVFPFLLETVTSCKVSPHLQWRNRTGLSPDFPFKLKTSVFSTMLLKYV